MHKLLLGTVAAAVLALATPASANWHDWCWYHPYDWRCQNGPSVGWGWWGWNNHHNDWDDHHHNNNDHNNWNNNDHHENNDHHDNGNHPHHR